jgi:site-specific recombinase XerD
MEKRILTAKQVQQLRSVCDTVTPKGKRDIAILDTILFQGLRPREVADLRIESFRNFGDQLTLHLKSRTYPIKIHYTLFQNLNTWMDQRGMSLENASGPVFVPIVNLGKGAEKPLASRTISHLVAKYGNLAGLPPKEDSNRLTPGDLRRTCARTAYNCGANLLSIQAFLGFNHLETVARYIGVLGFVDPDSVIDLICYKE